MYGIWPVFTVYLFSLNVLKLDPTSHLLTYGVQTFTVSNSNRAYWVWLFLTTRTGRDYRSVWPARRTRQVVSNVQGRRYTSLVGFRPEQDAKLLSIDLLTVGWVRTDMASTPQDYRLAVKLSTSSSANLAHRPARPMQNIYRCNNLLIIPILFTDALNKVLLIDESLEILIAWFIAG